MSRRYRKEYEAPDMEAMINRVVRALVRRAGDLDLEAVGSLARIEQMIHDEAIPAAAQAAHDASGYSWSEIGRELGITRQAAQQRGRRAS